MIQPSNNLTRMRAGLWILILFLALLWRAPAGAQSRATVTVEENLRAEPQGVIIGQLLEGTVLPVVQLQGRWVQVELEGWIWTPSIQTTDRQGFDLEVSAAPEENLRAEPRGTILARLLEGALLDEVEEGQGWTRVRRIAWVWGPSVDLDGPGQDTDVPTTTSPSAEDRGVGWWQVPEGGVAILTGPDGDTLGRGRSGTEIQFMARQGNWARVRLEGWIWAPPGEETVAAEDVAPGDLTPEDIAANPEAYRGRIVTWELQFVSREEAERVRTDFYEGEPFLLTRALTSGRTFVYVAVSPERLPQVQGLIPLERIRVVGRVRTGAAALTGNPIIDLLEFTRLQRE